MQHEGIERGGYANIFARMLRLRSKSTHQNASPVLVASK